MRFVMGVVMIGAFAWNGNAEEPVLRIKSVLGERTQWGIAIPVNLVEFGIGGDCYAITCAHLCESGRTITADGLHESFALEVVAKDEGFDIALLKANRRIASQAYRISRLKEVPNVATFFGSCKTEDIFTTEATYKESNGLNIVYHCDRFYLGGSGSAIIYRGELAAMATACLSVNGLPVESGASCLPARRIRQFIREYMEK